MKQQIIVSGIGGQGALFLTRVIAQVAVDMDIPVLTSETHGMAQRGGTVLSTLKVGDFASPLVRTGQGDIGLLLWEANLAVHQPLLRDDGALVINSEKSGDSEDVGVGERIDGSGIARSLGNAVLSNLVLLGYAVRKNLIFTPEDKCIAAIKKLAPERFVEQNLQAFDRGLNG